MKLPELPRTPTEFSPVMTLISASLPTALDQIIEECDTWEIDLVVWAMDNGFPDLETVLEYGR